MTVLPEPSTTFTAGCCASATLYAADALGAVTNWMATAAPAPSVKALVVDRVPSLNERV